MCRHEDLDATRTLGGIRRRGQGCRMHMVLRLLNPDQALPVSPNSAVIRANMRSVPLEARSGVQRTSALVHAGRNTLGLPTPEARPPTEGLAPTA